MLTVHACIEVTEPVAGITFYCDGLGLTVKRHLSSRWIELAGANLPEVADLGTTIAKRDYSRHWTPVHLDFVVTDLDARVARLVALGGTLDRAVKDREYGRIANMADPFGNGFDLIEFSGSGYDG